MSIPLETLEGLAAKLDSLELTAGEQEVLDLVLSRAASADDEVGGFMFDPFASLGATTPPRLPGTTWSSKLVAATGFADVDNDGNGFSKR